MKPHRNVPLCSHIRKTWRSVLGFAVVLMLVFTSLSPRASGGAVWTGASVYGPTKTEVGGLLNNTLEMIPTKPGLKLTNGSVTFTTNGDTTLNKLMTVNIYAEREFTVDQAGYTGHSYNYEVTGSSTLPVGTGTLAMFSAVYELNSKTNLYNMLVDGTKASPGDLELKTGTNPIFREGAKSGEYTLAAGTYWYDYELSFTFTPTKVDQTFSIAYTTSIDAGLSGLSAVPEPSSWVLLMPGVVAVVCMSWKSTVVRE